jgi:hypothetical protein
LYVYVQCMYMYSVCICTVYVYVQCMYMYIVSQKFLYAREHGWFLMCGKWESRKHDTLGSIHDHKHTPMRVTCDTLGSILDHKHTPMRVTCSTHYCTFTVTSDLAFTLFLTDAKGFWLTLYIYTQIHTNMHIARRWPSLNWCQNFLPYVEAKVLKPITRVPCWSL